MMHSNWGGRPEEEAGHRLRLVEPQEITCSCADVVTAGQGGWPRKGLARPGAEAATLSGGRFLVQGGGRWRS